MPTTHGGVRLALIGAGRIGSHHATTLVQDVYEAELTLIADPVADNAARLADSLGVEGTDDLDRAFNSSEVDGVIITASSTAHADLIQRAAAGGKAVFCEKPMSMSLAEFDASIAACERAAVPLQVGFNRRFASDFQAARRLVVEGALGTPQLLRSTTRDPGPGPANPGVIPPWTIFTQTLIHDFDTVLWLNAGARAIEVHAFADALIAPDFKASGLLDTAVVTIRFDNGAIATAEASFSSAYGYDVRGEVFGSAGMATFGSPSTLTLQHWSSEGVHGVTERSDTTRLHDAYVGELTAFCRSVRDGAPVQVGGKDARAAFEVALAAIASVERSAAVRINDITGDHQ